MAATPLLDQYKADSEYLTKIGAIVASDYQRRAAGQEPEVNAKDLADNLKQNVGQVIDRISNLLRETLYFSDVKRNEVSTPWPITAKVDSIAIIKNKSTGEIDKQVVTKVNPDNSILVGYNNLYGEGPMEYVWKPNIGGWLYAGRHIWRYKNIISEPIDDHTIYTIEFTPSRRDAAGNIIR